MAAAARLLPRSKSLDLAKAALLTGDAEAGAALIEAHGAAGWVVPAHGPPLTCGGVERLCWPEAEAS